MNDTIRVSDVSVMYQGVQPAYVISKNKVKYCQIKGEFQNDAIHLSYNIEMKRAYVKKCGMDLVSDSRTVIQKRGNEFFILFDIVKDQFKTGPEGRRFAENTVKTSDYYYTLRFDELDREQVVKDTISTNAKDVFNNILKEYGLNGEAGNNPSDSYVASWKIGHPESKIEE